MFILLTKEAAFEFLKKEFIIFDFVLGVVLVVIGLVWMIGLIWFLKRKKKKLQKNANKKLEK